MNRRSERENKKSKWRDKNKNTHRHIKQKHDDKWRLQIVAQKKNKERTKQRTARNGPWRRRRRRRVNPGWNMVANKNHTPPPVPSAQTLHTSWSGRISFYSPTHTHPHPTARHAREGGDGMRQQGEKVFRPTSVKHSVGHAKCKTKTWLKVEGSMTPDLPTTIHPPVWEVFYQLTN